MGHPGADQPLLEAVLGHGLQHANVVETYKYATRRAEVEIRCLASVWYLPTLAALVCM